MFTRDNLYVDGSSMAWQEDGHKAAYEVGFEQNLKLVSIIFYQIFILSPNCSPSETMKSVFYFV